MSAIKTDTIIDVVVGVIKDTVGRYLIAKRPTNAHQGGLWEFPGGKVEHNETAYEALERELNEELGISSLSSITSLIKIYHDYGDKKVCLDVYTIDDFSGEAFGKEGQELRWIGIDEFSKFNFPEANYSIINAVTLPDQYMITGEFKSEAELLARIQTALDSGLKLIQFRAHQLNDEIYFNYTRKIYQMCKTAKAKLLLNISLENYTKYKADNFSDGIHLSSKEIKLFHTSMLNSHSLVATSTHNEDELIYAEEKKIDFIVLSPVNPTTSHPNTTPLGWDNFKSLVNKSTIPVYALGGMTKSDLSAVKKRGGQGIAAISEYWKSEK
ncbi:MAG: Nudix family hydrolase [Woeseiaceae bacterium]